MKIYVVNGYGFDPQESSMELYSKVFKERAEAEIYVNEVMDEQISFSEAKRTFGIEYSDVKACKNGNLKHWNLQEIFDINQNAQKEEFLYSTLVIGGNIKNDEFVPKINNLERPEIRIVTVAHINIREVEV